MSCARRKRQVEHADDYPTASRQTTARIMAFVRNLLGADRAWNALAAGLLLGAAILIGLTFTDYGVTWDEGVHNWYGNFALDYYLSLFTDELPIYWLNLYNYGGAFNMNASAVNKISTLAVSET